MTNKKATQISNKTRKTGLVNVGVDGNILRLQFPSKVSQAIWGKAQKYKSLGLYNTPENMNKAQQIALIAHIDLLEDKFDITLEKYNPFLLEKTIEQVKPDMPGVLELCKKHFEVKIKPNIEAATQRNYKLYLNTIQECDNYDIIKDAVKIRDSIRKVRTAPRTKKILSFIYETIQWGKRNELIPKNVENPYKELQEGRCRQSKLSKTKAYSRTIRGRRRQRLQGLFSSRSNSNS
jgi:integrase